MTVILTNRERQILKLIARGFTNKEIATLLSISESTTENHIHHIYTKLGVSNRAQAVAYVFQFINLQQPGSQESNGGNPS
jgi:DNA-binding NarL/FixJ family response regulator